MMRQKPPFVPVSRNDTRKSDSLARTIARYEGKLAIMATHAQNGSDRSPENKRYMSELRHKIYSLRIQLRCKGLNLINRDEIDDMTNL